MTITSIKESADKASLYAGEKLREAGDKVREASARVRDSASSARARAGDAIEDNPLAAVAGGLALGALVAALLPRSKAENSYLGDIGDRISGAVRKASDAARSAGRERLDEMGINQTAAREKVGQLIDSAVEAVSAAGGAARSAIHGRE